MPITLSIDIDESKLSAILSAVGLAPVTGEKPAKADKEKPAPAAKGKASKAKEPEPEEDDEDEELEEYTEAMLKKKTAKQLKEIAADEFDIDVADLKTKDDLIEAILEEQDAEEDDDEDEDDEEDEDEEEEEEDEPPAKKKRRR